MNGTELPLITTPLPGPGSQRLVDVLARHECPAVTARRARRASSLGVASDDPFVWRSARGAAVEDVDGNRLVDMTSGFGVALVGHRAPEVVSAVREQSEHLLHAMGDAYPDATRIKLLEAIARVTPAGLEASILGLSGADAVDAAVKTAILASGRSAVIAFEGGYHGLSLGTVGLQGYKQAFTQPFDKVTHPEVHFVPWGCSPSEVARAVTRHQAGLLLLEPVQGRGGMREAPAGWLAEVGEAARREGAIVCVDEIQSGLGRTGSMWGSEAEGLTPDLLCIGKALGGGFPISACVGTRTAMDSWGASRGEAIHTQTFLGHPIGCAAALAVLAIIERDNIPARAHAVSTALRSGIEGLGLTTRGRGLMIGVELGSRSLAVSRGLLRRGWIALPAGMSGEVLALTPPAVLSHEQTTGFVEALAETLAEVA